ncbi:MAG: 5'-methylthioadenosine/adenosylhomocysteine nucleosidase [Verrucomicrobiota bacterium]
MRVGILGAMAEDTDAILEKFKVHRHKEIGKRLFHEGKWEGHEVVVAFSRWGKVAAAGTVTTMLDVYDVDQIIFTGVAGGASPEIEVGDIVIAEYLVQHDFDASPVPGLQRYEIPLLGVIKFQVFAKEVKRAKMAAEHFLKEAGSDLKHRDVLRSVSSRGPKVHVGLIASGDQFIASAQKLEEMRKDFPELLCVEMEGAAVAQVCYERGVPFTVVRSISDKADHAAVTDFPKFLNQIAKWYSAEIVERILKTLEA